MRSPRAISRSKSSTLPSLPPPLQTYHSPVENGSGNDVGRVFRPSGILQKLPARSVLLEVRVGDVSREEVAAVLEELGGELGGESGGGEGGLERVTEMREGETEEREREREREVMSGVLVHSTRPNALASASKRFRVVKSPPAPQDPPIPPSLPSTFGNDERYLPLNYSTGGPGASP